MKYSIHTLASLVLLAVYIYLLEWYWRKYGKLEMTRI